MLNEPVICFPLTSSPLRFPSFPIVSERTKSFSPRLSFDRLGIKRTLKRTEEK